MSKHTPGPWEAAEGHPSDVWHVDMPERSFSIILSRADSDWSMSVDEVQANARLIAAAPELLAALERTLSNAIGHACDARGDDCNFEDWPWVQQAREAINNATKEEA